jgi:hypothetical protein
MWRLLLSFLAATAVGATGAGIVIGSFLALTTETSGGGGGGGSALGGWRGLEVALLLVAIATLIIIAARATVRRRSQTEVIIGGDFVGGPKTDPRPFELVLADGTRVPLVGEVTLGRDPSSTVVLRDPSVSRRHARIAPGDGDGPLVEDAGSRHGTFVDGVRVTGPVRLRDGARLMLGDCELVVERAVGAVEAGRTRVVPSSIELHDQVSYTGWGSRGLVHPPLGQPPTPPEPPELPRQVPYRLQVAATVAGMITGVAGVVVGVLSL